jgi:hypothetical protein
MLASPFHPLVHRLGVGAAPLLAPSASCLAHMRVRAPAKGHGKACVRGLRETADLAAHARSPWDELRVWDPGD